MHYVKLLLPKNPRKEQTTEETLTNALFYSAEITPLIKNNVISTVRNDASAICKRTMRCDDLLHMTSNKLLVRWAD